MGPRSGVTVPTFWIGSEGHSEARWFRPLVDAVDTVGYYLDVNRYFLAANTAFGDATGYESQPYEGW